MEDIEEEEEEELRAPWKSLSLLPCSKQFEKTNPEEALKLYHISLKNNPNSYKLWRNYLQLNMSIPNKSHKEVISCFEEALVTMDKMPRIWMDYCSYLTTQELITKTRRTFDRALISLPITQHFRIWVLYLDFIKHDFIPVESALRVYKRYVQLYPENSEDCVDYLYSKNFYDEAATMLCSILNQPKFISKRNKSKHELWEDLCQIICLHAETIISINVDMIIRDGITRYRDQQGKLWNTLAGYYTSLGLFNHARDVYEEAMKSVMTKKHFAEVWDAYSKSEEEYIRHFLENDIQLSEEEFLDLEIRQNAFEKLIEQRELLSNSVSLRQNPHNVKEWQKRIELYDRLYDLNHDDKLIKAKLDAYEQAIKAVDPKLAVGNIEELWIEYALIYYRLGHLPKSRQIFEQATKAKYSSVKDLVKLWCAYIEFEFMLDLSSESLISNWNSIKLIKKATTLQKFHPSDADIQGKLHKSLDLWLFYADMEENFGNFESTKAVYDKIIDLKIATPQVIINYASILEERNYFEHSFRVYEKGVNLFKWPDVYPIWATYLIKHVDFLSKQSTGKLDRIRDLFEQCLKDCPKKYNELITLLYVKIELEFGLISRAKAILHKAVKMADNDELSDRVYKLLVLLRNKQTAAIES